jgi:hypothetical protein
MAKHPKRLCETAQLAASVPCDHDGSTDRVGGPFSPLGPRGIRTPDNAAHSD